MLGVKDNHSNFVDELVKKHLYVAEIVARKFSGRGVDFDDLYQVASLALFKAAKRYDPKREIKFVSFATPTMVGEVKNYFRDHSRLIRLPRKGTNLAKQISEARDRLSQILMRSPTIYELAEQLKLSQADS